MPKVKAQDTPPQNDETPAADPAPETAIKPNPLHSAAGREWLRRELAAAENEEQHGPNGRGWRYNETLRPAIVERVEFLRALVALVEAQDAKEGEAEGEGEGDEKK